METTKPNDVQNTSEKEQIKETVEQKQTEDKVATQMGINDPQVDTITDDFDRLTGIPEEIKSGWKTKYDSVFRIWFLQEQYIYRNFTYFEYKALRTRIRDQYKDDVEAGDDAFKEEIQKLCVLWPTDYKSRLETSQPKPIPGGIPFLLGDYILAASGFSDSIIPDVISNAS